MTIYKAVRNFLTVFVVLAVAAGALCIGGGVYYAVQSAASSQVLSKLGSTGAEVTRVQKKLKELGYYSGAADGIYGNALPQTAWPDQRPCCTWGWVVAAAATAPGIRMRMWSCWPR